MSRLTKNLGFAYGLLMSAVIFLAVFPGIDVALYFFLRPLNTFFTKVIFLSIAFLTALPEIWFGFILCSVAFVALGAFLEAW